MYWRLCCFLIATRISDTKFSTSHIVWHLIMSSYLTVEDLFLVLWFPLMFWFSRKSYLFAPFLMDLCCFVSKRCTRLCSPTVMKAEEGDHSRQHWRPLIHLVSFCCTIAGPNESPLLVRNIESVSGSTLVSLVSVIDVLLVMMFLVLVDWTCSRSSV